MQDYGGALALAGPAEAGLSFELLVDYAILATIVIVALIGFLKKSMIAASIAFGLALLITALAMPWYAFAPLTAQDLEDSDIQYWVDKFRIFGIAWMVVTIAVLICFIMNLRKRLTKKS